MSKDDDEDPAAYLTRQLGTKTVQDINLILLEGLFFYRKDDVVLFARLSERQTPFKRFWDRYLGLDLIVEENVAYRRVRQEGDEIDSGFRNPAIPPSARSILQWSGPGKRERSLVFMLFLQFYEGDLRRREDAGYGERLFFHHEFYRFVQDNFNRWFQDRGEERPNDRILFHAVTDVLETLTTYRFVEKAQIEDVNAQDRALLPQGYESDRVFLYKALDGLRGYRPHTLMESIALRAYGRDQSPEPEPGQEVASIGQE